MVKNGPPDESTQIRRQQARILNRALGKLKGLMPKLSASATQGPPPEAQSGKGSQRIVVSKATPGSASARGKGQGKPPESQEGKGAKRAPATPRSTTPRTPRSSTPRDAIRETPGASSASGGAASSKMRPPRMPPMVGEVNQEFLQAQKKKNLEAANIKEYRAKAVQKRWSDVDNSMKKPEVANVEDDSTHGESHTAPSASASAASAGEKRSRVAAKSKA